MIPGATDAATAGEPARSNVLYGPAMALPYVMTASLTALLIYSHVYGEPFRVSAEDGFVEWGTVAAFGVWALLSVATVVARWADFSRAQKVLLILMAVVAVVAVGEELSWGQRYFGFEPPESMVSGGGGMVQMGHNDVTWHNLSFELGPLKFSVGGMLFGIPLLGAIFVHGIWLPRQVRARRPRPTRLVERLGLFLPPVHLGILLLVAAAAFHYAKASRNTESREYKELLVPAVYIFMMLHAYFRERRPLNTIVTAATIALLAAGLALSVAASLPN